MRFLTFLFLAFLASVIAYEVTAQTGLKILQAQADKNNPDAQTKLGDLYHKGQDVKKDELAAATWWLKAAEQGQQQAQINLSNLYATGGENFPQIYDLAYFWRKIKALFC